MVRGAVRFLRAPEVQGEAALISLFNVAAVLGYGLLSGKAAVPMLLLAAGVGAVTRLSDLYFVRLWQSAEGHEVTVTWALPNNLKVKRLSGVGPRR